jgi:hypothetical protein
MFCIGAGDCAMAGAALRIAFKTKAERLIPITPLDQWRSCAKSLLLVIIILIRPLPLPATGAVAQN